MYSPFVDNKGNPLELSKIRFHHLKQLKTIDEGYKVEFKMNFDKSVKDKVPAIIASFANSEGGWLIVGIEDDSHDITCILYSKDKVGLQPDNFSMIGGKNFANPIL